MGSNTAHTIQCIYFYSVDFFTSLKDASMYDSTVQYLPTAVMSLALCPACQSFILTCVLSVLIT